MAHSGGGVPLDAPVDKDFKISKSKGLAMKRHDISMYAHKARRRERTNFQPPGVKKARKASAGGAGKQQGRAFLPAAADVV
jgi:hypothetical protein